MSDDPDARPSKKAKTEVSPAVASFFTKASEKPKSELHWHVHKDTLLIAKFKDGGFRSPKKDLEVPQCIKVAAFDLDGTLIKTKSGGRFPKDEYDWAFLHAKVPIRLRELYDQGHHVVIFSNQAGIKLTDTAKRYAQYKSKIKALLDSVNVPLILYAATAHDIFRKPRVGMMEKCLLDIMEMYSDADIDLDMSQSFFVGDAGGRPVSAANSVQDFSASDRKFALNCGLKFHSPEEYFLGRAQVAVEITGFDPVIFKNPVSADHLFVKSDTQEIVMFVGSPASGKSTYYHTFLNPLGYVRINQDTLKTRQRCLERAKEELTRGHSICIDNTNANRETRAHWLKLATQIGSDKIPVRVLHFTASVSLCEHNNAVRAFSPREAEEKREVLPAVAFTSFSSRYEQPKMDEGFSRLDKVDFVLTGTEEEERVWRQYWT